MVKRMDPATHSTKRVAHTSAIGRLLDEACEKLPLDVLADLRSKIARLVQEALQEGQERPPENVEYWWIHSSQNAPWAGFRMAQFGRAVNGPAWFFIIGESDPSRVGLRDWETKSVEEGWRKVERIPVPVMIEE